MTTQPDGAEGSIVPGRDQGPDATGAAPAGSVVPGPAAPIVPAMPVGPVRWWTAACTLGAGALIALTAYADPVLLAAALTMVVLALAWGWPHLLGMPSVGGSAVVVAASGVAAVLAVTLTEHEPLLQWLALALAAGVIAEFVHELVRRDGRPRLVDSVAGAVVAIAVLGSMSALAALPQTVAGSSGVLVAVAPVAVGLALLAAPAPARILGLAAVIASTLIAGLLGGLLPGPTMGAGLLVGALSGAVAVLLHQLLSALPPAGRLPGWVALALAPLAATGMVGYVVLRLLVG